MATAMETTEVGIDYALIVVGSIAVIAGLALILQPPVIPIHLLGVFSALGGTLLLSAGLINHNEGWGVRTTLAVLLQIVTAVVVVVLVLTLHILPM